MFAISERIVSVGWQAAAVFCHIEVTQSFLSRRVAILSEKANHMNKESTNYQKHQSTLHSDILVGVVAVVASSSGVIIVVAAIVVATVVVVIIIIRPTRR